jgi:hypothetical protein
VLSARAIASIGVLVGPALFFVFLRLQIQDFSGVIAKHCVSFASARLPVHQDRAIDALQRRMNDVFTRAPVYVAIHHFFVVTVVECETPSRLLLRGFLASRLQL